MIINNKHLVEYYPNSGGREGLYKLIAGFKCLYEDSNDNNDNSNYNGPDSNTMTLKHITVNGPDINTDDTAYITDDGPDNNSDHTPIITDDCPDNNTDDTPNIHDDGTQLYVQDTFSTFFYLPALTYIYYNNKMKNR